MKAAISPLTPASSGSDLNPVISTDCMCSVKCAEAAWNYKSGRYRPFSHCIDQAGLGAFTAKSGRKHYNPPSIDHYVNELWLSQFC